MQNPRITKTLDRPRHYIVRTLISLVLGIGLLSLVRVDLVLLAVALAFASKWQMFLGGWRVWPRSFRDNAVDIVVIASVVTLFNFYNDIYTLQLYVLGLYLLWQLVVKPMTEVTGHATQALFALLLGVGTIFIYIPAITFAGAIIGVWVVALATGDHYIRVYEQPGSDILLVTTWALIAAQVAWLLGQWNVIYQFYAGNVLVPQAAIVLVVLGYIFGSIYHDHTRKMLGRKRLALHLGLLTILFISVIIGSEWVSRI